jgi:nicotinate phosphoribosyltransferase
MTHEQSILDDDLYKFTMQQAVLECYPDAWGTAEFISRKPTPINQDFVTALKLGVQNMRNLRLQSFEREWFGRACPFLKPSYLGYLQGYQYDPTEVTITAPDKADLTLQDVKIKLNAPWHKFILWEVKLLALISKTYFQTVDKKWTYDGQEEQIIRKGRMLSEAGCVFADFGTRRRRSFETQDLVVRNLVKFPGCVGTSNVYLAMMHNTKAIGTMAHEWIMGVSALESLRYANRYALQNWNRVYNGDLGIALTDTFGTAAFFEDFDKQLARLFDGVRHDSADPFEFTDKVVAHYKKLRIPTNEKTIVFSDSLDCELCLRLKKYCDERNIRCSFGIGTHLTNDFAGSPALNIVLKLRSMRRNKDSQEIQVVKLSDVFSKATGEADALRVAMWMFANKPLDA